MRYFMSAPAAPPVTQPLVPLYNYCIDKQNRHTRLMDTIKNIVALVAAVLTGFGIGIALSTGAGVLVTFLSFFTYDALLTALNSRFASRKFENAGLALTSPDFIKFVNQNQIDLNRDTVFGAHKAYVIHCKAQLAQTA